MPSLALKDMRLKLVSKCVLLTKSIMLSSELLGLHTEHLTEAGCDG